MRVKLEFEDLELAARIGLERNIKCIKRGLIGRNKQDPYNQWGDHVLGACAECAVAKALGVYWNGGRFKEPDIGVLEVRYSRGNDLIVRDTDKDASMFVLVTGSLPVLHIRGVMRGEQAKQPQFRQARAGRPAAYFVPAQNLDRLWRNPK